MSQTRHQRKAFSRWFDKLGSATGMIKAADGSPVVRSWLAKILAAKTPKPEPRQLLPLKHIRLQQLADAGFNTPPFNYWLRGELNPTELTDFLREYKRISLRNFMEEGLFEQTPKLPVKYDQDDPDFIVGYCQHYNRIHHTLVNQAIPLRDSLLAGNIILLDDDKYIVSYLEGYRTPRDTDDDPNLKIYIRRSRIKAPEWAPPQIEDLVVQLQASHLKFSPIISKTFEFSIYPYNIGILQRPEIFWEWRSGSAHDLFTVIYRLLERSNSQEMIFQLPSLQTRL